MSQPEESQEKTSKVDEVLLKPVLKDLEELREGEGEGEADDTAAEPSNEDEE